MYDTTNNPPAEHLQASRELTPTQQSVLEQLTENTGRHLLDSGDAYGRSWQRNQTAGADLLLAVPETSLSVRWGYIEITHNLIHWLPERVDYLPELDEVFAAWSNADKGESETYRYDAVVKAHRADLPWLQNAEEFAVLLGGRGIYGDGDPVVVNTYNGEDLLSQTIQYVYFTLEGDVTLLKREHEETGLDLVVVDPEDYTEQEGDLVTIPAGEYCLLQVHGGADVRGGYTRPRLYATSIEEHSLLDNARASLYCTSTHGTVDNGQDLETCEARWYTDDGSSWDSDEGHVVPSNDTIRFVDEEAEIPADRTGIFWAVKETNTLHCPLCFGEIAAAPY